MRPPSACLILYMVLNATALLGAQVQSYTADAVLQYAKSINVAKLDSTLSSQKLEDFLRGPARIDELNWRVSRDCDLKDTKPDAHGDLPLCVKVGFRRGSITGFGVLRVGTLKHGVGGQPAFLYLDVLRPCSIESYNKLSDFPHFLDAIDKAHKTKHEIHLPNPYPHELPHFRFHGAYLSPLRPYVSGLDSVIRVLGSPQGRELERWHIQPFLSATGTLWMVTREPKT